MNSVFVMTHKEIDIAKMAGHKWTYAWVVIDYQPLKEDPNRIRIAVGGNLIKYREKSARLSSQQALNVMTMQEALTPPSAFTPRTFVPIAYENNVLNFAHFASSMAHPTTGQTISSYKRLMNDPETAEVWQTAFGKDFSGMAQGDNKTGQKGMHSVFVMTHKEIDIAKVAGHKWTYARVFVTNPKRRIPIESGSQSEATSSHIEETHRHALPISPLQNCYGTVSSAQKAHVLCALILKISTSRQPWIITNT
jgi:hypothetical protein